MPSARDLPHILVTDRASTETYHAHGGGSAKVRSVDGRRVHGRALVQQLDEAITEYAEEVAALGYTQDELLANGVVVSIQAADPDYPLRLDSMDSRSNHKEPRPKWQLLAVTDWEGDRPETAVVWISDDYVDGFFKLLRDYIDKNGKPSESAPEGRPRNAELVANMGAIRSSVARDFWTSPGDPPEGQLVWWEIWLRRESRGMVRLKTWAQLWGLAVGESTLRLDQREVAVVRSTWEQLHDLPFTAVPVAEIRRAATIDTVEDLDPDEQAEYVADLAARVEVSPGPSAPTVCLLDTGLRRPHILLEPAVAAGDMHTVFPSGVTADLDGHGTKMAGLALLGPLDALLTTSQSIVVDHGLESVRLLSEREPSHAPAQYPLVTAQGVSLPEIAQPDRQRVFSLAITAEEASLGDPTTWSAALDALAAGVDVDVSDTGIALISEPDPSAARLIVVSAGNIRDGYVADYRALSDVSVIEEPAQAWNALTVGAFTDLVQVPSDPSLRGWRPLAEAGTVSPYSRSGVNFRGQWPNKPDIVMEGGNRLFDGVSDTTNHPVVSLRTTANDSDVAIGSATATSAATAQAARLAARVMVQYPDYWPETVRGLMVHSARWTSAMEAEFAGLSKSKRRQLLQRYGWGVPSPDRLERSASDDLTLVVQDEFVPFQGRDFALREFRLHELPWPEAELRGLGEAEVELRLTLSYFVEPAASRRGWRRKFTYQSHGLRFALRRPHESTAEFVRRVNREGSADGSDSWLLGENQRDKGSIHSDIWTGTAAELARCGVLAVHGVGGWWKYNARRDRVDAPVRYALLLSLSTASAVDLYAPVVAQLALPIEVEVLGN